MQDVIALSDCYLAILAMGAGCFLLGFLAGVSQGHAMEDWKQKLQELLDLEEGLTEWEVNFIQSMDKQNQRATFRPSPRQLETLEKIHSKRCS